jgi:1,4-alpha-glucan branching enzyme
MNKMLLIISWLSLTVFSLSGQVVTTDPALPTMSKPVKIYYDTSKDAGDLHNFTSDLYVHTGVTVNGVNWQNVIGTWAVNSTQPKLAYLGNYIYELDITPDIKTFYSLPVSSIATKICLVFRNSSGSLQTRPDIFIDIFESGLNATFTLPEKSSLIAELNETIPVKAVAAGADSLTLYLNNKYLTSGTGPDQVTYSFTTDQYGEFWVKAVAWDKPAFSADSFFVYVRRPVVTEPLPAGMKDGINYNSNSSVTLVLHAPYKNYVFTTGDFTDWRIRDKGYLKRTPDAERYWIRIDGLESGKEYRFQYFVDNEIYIADPYADKILDPWNDPYITDETYPGLIPYPKDTASGIVSILQTSQVPYTWKTTGYTPPEKSKLTIYELLIRDFVAKHDFRTLTDTLSYLDDLGINAIELMPVSEFEGNLSWGYNPSFYFAPDKYYGPKNDMKAFVDSCHKRGIAVIMDIVLNHCMGQSPLVQLYLDHYGTDQIFIQPLNPWFNVSSPNTLYKWGADFNHEKPSTQQLVDRINAYWLTEYKIDGFRFDFTKGFTNTAGDGSAYDASRIAILKRMADKIWSVNPDAYVILEHFAPDAEEKELADYGMMLWGNKNHDYSEAAMGYSSDLTTASSLGRGWTVPRLVTYMESHDEERLMFKNVSFGDATGDYDTRNRKVALKRMQLDALFFLSIPGPKMIWQFGELGYDISIDENGRTGEKPIKWDYYSDEERHPLYLTYKLLNNLRKSQPAFSTSNYSYALATPGKRLTLTGETMKVNILGNFGMASSTINPAFPQIGKWYEYFTRDSITVTNTSSLFTFKPGEFRLYTTQKLALSELVTAVDDQISETEEQKISVYPNPFDKETTISFAGGQISVSSKIEIFSAFGTLVRTIIVPAGTNQVTWDGRTSGGANAAKGLYIIRVSPGQKNAVQKVIKK